MHGVTYHCCADRHDTTWYCGSLDRLRDWIAKRNELLAVIDAVPASPFRSTSPLGFEVPARGNP